MTSGLFTVIYPVRDLAQAKTLYAALLGEPHTDAPYYVGFRVGDQEVGLDPHGHDQGLTGSVGYWTVDDVKEQLSRLVSAGAQELQPVRDVGGGKLIASVKERPDTAAAAWRPRPAAVPPPSRCRPATWQWSPTRTTWPSSSRRRPRRDRPPAERSPRSRSSSANRTAC